MFSFLLYKVNHIITDINLVLLFYSQEVPLDAKGLVQVNCSVWSSPGVSREKQNSNCEKSIYSVKQLTIWHRDVRS